MKVDVERALRDSLEQFLLETGLSSFARLSFILAVSGGADSVFLLCALHELASRYGFGLSVVTVDHRMRPEPESAGDARFVEALCYSLNPLVPCKTFALETDQVATVAVSRGKGLEEAARYLRYRVFEQCLTDSPESWILTAHTASDQLETLLMRFLQGGSRSGISRIRGRFFRPILDIEREDLESWLIARKYTWRTDKSNVDLNYRRNLIRARLVPFLDAEFSGWRSGVRTGLACADIDENCLSSGTELNWTNNGDGMSCAASEFFSIHPARRLRAIKNALITLKIGHRVPSAFLLRMASVACPTEDDDIRICGSRLEFKADVSRVYLGHDIVQNSKSSYLIWVCAPCECVLPQGPVQVVSCGSGVRIGTLDASFTLPLVLRSRKPGDTILSADGKQKTLKKIFTDWSVPLNMRDLIPVIEVDGELRAVWASPFGFPDWCVYN